METNVFSQFRDWRRRRADQATPAEIERVATMRNDKTYADEAAWIVRALLYLTAAFCAWAVATARHQAPAKRRISSSVNGSTVQVIKL